MEAAVTSMRRGFLRSFAGAAVFGVLLASTPAHAADPIKVGFSMALTGGFAPIGKQILTAVEIWRDDVNAKGGLLGRPIKLVYYDDQSNPATVPAIYAKLLNLDHADLLIGPYATPMIAAAMPAIMQNNKMTIGILGLSVNKRFKNYPRYFSMTPLGPEGPSAFSKGFFELAAAQTPKPRTVAIIAADGEFPKTSSDGARQNAKAAGFEIIYDRTYPPNTSDFTSVMRAVKAANPDIVFAAAYPPDTVGIVRAADEIGLTPKMFGGSLIGLTATAIKMQLGPLVNGFVNYESFMPSFKFAGTAELMQRYEAKATSLGVDPLGYAFAPFAYAAGQLTAQAVTETKSLDPEKLAAYLHSHTIQTVVGPLAFGADGEWTRPGIIFTQFQNVNGHDIGQFKGAAKEPIIWPRKSATGNLIYPYGKAKTE